MKIKTFALCAIAAAISGCNIDLDHNSNTLGSISLSGTPTSGETLSVSVSDPDGISDTISYYWYADGTAIDGANTSSLTLTDEQIGTVITAQALYTDDGNTNESHITDGTSEVSAIAFDSSITISGDAFVGAELTATVTDGNGIEDATILYTWLADDVAIDGASQATYTLTDDEFGTIITVMAEFEDDQGFAETVTSAGTDIVARVNATGTVSIQGTPTVGNTLVADITDEDGVTGSVGYQWYADDEAIIGATDSTYVVDASLVGTVITVQVVYTDDNDFSEDNTSAPTITVASVAIDEAGSIEILGISPYMASATLTAVITDNNGVDDTNVVYTWMADGDEIMGSDSSTFTPTDYAGSIISVSASYTDNDGFVDTVADTLDTLVYTQVVDDAAALVSAVNDGLADGDVVGLNTNLYTDMEEILLTSAVTLRAVEEQAPVISGETCIYVADGVDGAMITELSFKDIDTKSDSVCESEEEAIVYSEGDNFVFTQNSMDGDEEELNEETYHWIVLKGEGALIERNTFSGRNNAVKGSVIKLASSGADHVIQYNLFEDSSENENFDESSLLLLNIGSTTGEDAADEANFVVRYNRIDNFVSGRRLMRVQTSGATIHGNTIVNANGGISLEDGGFNTVTDNIIIRTTDIASSDDRPSGVLITPLGHTVTNNYIAGIRSGNKEAGGIVFTVNPFSQADGGVPNSGNQAVLDGSGDLSLTVTNNTVLNSLQPIVFSTEIGSNVVDESNTVIGDCDELTSDHPLYSLSKNFFVIDFDANLIANGLNDSATYQGLYFPSEDIESDHAFEYDCDLINHDESYFSNNYGFMDSYMSGDTSGDWVDIRKVDGNGEFDTDGAIDQITDESSVEMPEFITSTTALTETDSAGAQAIAGAKGLHYILATEVGVGSTWEADDE
jgi:parallel beta-helix repeat protein